MASNIYRRMFESAKDGLLILDAETGKIVDINPSLIDLLGYTKQNFIEKSIWEIGAFQDIIENEDKFLELQQEEYVRYDDLPLVTSDGREIYVEFVSNVYLVENQKVIQFQIREITEQKGKKDALKETHRETSNFLGNLLNLMHAPIIIWDTSMIIKRFNRQFELLSGYDSTEVIDKKIDFLFPKEKIAASLELLKNLLADEQEVVEIDILTKDNQIKTVLWNSSRILDEEGKNIIATISQDITSRRQSELALRKSESHLRTLVKTIPDLIWLKDTNGVYLSCNALVERFLGARETDIIGKTDYDFVDRELADFFRENDRKAMEAGKPTSNEEWVTYADDGHRAFLDTIKTPIYDSDGTLLGVLGIGRDITERKLTRQVLQTSEERFRAIFDQAPIAIAIFDFQGRPILSNFRLSKMLGYTKGELSKMKFSEFTHPEDIDKVLNQFTDLKDGKISGFSMEKRHIHKNRNVIWANLIVTALNDNNGVPQEIIAMIEDITEQKKSQDEIKFQADLLNNVGQAVIATDLQGTVIYWNHAAEKIYGWSTSEAIGQNIIDLTPARQTKEQAIHIMKKLSAGKTWAGEFQVKRKDGSSFPAFVTNSPINDSNGKLTGICGISINISKRKRAEMELKEAKKKAEESDWLKSAFLANMSHEIRTPMNGILGFTELLLSPDLSSEQKANFITIIHQSGQRMLNTVNDIVEISKIEAGFITVDLKEVDVQISLDELIRFFTPEATKKGLKLTLENEVPKTVAVISTDQNKLDSILTNLIKNAIKYTPEGEIRVGCMVQENSLEFYVKDTGIGIPAERQQAVFERFIQADDKDARKGAGLGLAITKAYVEMLGGKIWVESEEDKGSTFYFTLPYSTEPLKETIDQQSAPSGKTETIRKLKILVAEDDEVSEMLIDNYVKTFGKEILKARTGVEAVEVCRTNPDIDLILMDIQMPEKNGYEATHQIREFNKEVIIIAQTAFGLTGDREKSIEAGCNDYIAKPINEQALLEKIQKYF